MRWLFIVLFVGSLGMVQAQNCGLYHGKKVVFTGTEKACQQEYKRRCDNERSRQLNGRADRLTVVLTDKYMANYRAGFEIDCSPGSERPANSSIVGGSGRQNNSYSSDVNVSGYLDLSSGNSSGSVGERVVQTLMESAVNSLVESAVNSLVNWLFSSDPGRRESPEERQARLEAEQAQFKHIKEETKDLKESLRGYKQNRGTSVVKETNVSEPGLQLKRPVIKKTTSVAVINEPDLPAKERDFYCVNAEGVWDAVGNDSLREFYAPVSPESQGKMLEQAESFKQEWRVIQGKMEMAEVGKGYNIHLSDFDKQVLEFSADVLNGHVKAVSGIINQQEANDINKYYKFRKKFGENNEQGKIEY